MNKVSKGLWITVGIICVVVFFLLNHYFELFSRALVSDISKQFAYAGNNLLASFNPFSDVFFVVGTSLIAMIAGFLGALIIFGVFVSSVSKGTFRSGEEHGSARWATSRELAHYRDAQVPTNNMPLCKEVSVRIPKGGKFAEVLPNSNGVVLGGSGCGKTFGLIKPALMAGVPDVRNGINADGSRATLEEMEASARSFFITDSKGMTVVESGYLFAENPDTTMRMFNVIDFAASNHFNPFAYITSPDMAMSFATCLIKNTSGSDDPNRDDFWEKSERKLMNCVTKLMITEFPPEERNFRTMVKLVDMMQIKHKDDLSPFGILIQEIETGRDYSPQDGEVNQVKYEHNHWRNIDVDNGVWVPAQDGREPRPNHPAVLAWNDIMSSAEETLCSIIISLKVRLEPFASESVLSALDFDEMELDKMGDRKQVVYCVFNDQDDTYNFLVAIMIWIMLKQLYLRCQGRYAATGGYLPHGVHLLFDEAANFYVPNLDGIISTCRSRNIAIWMILQSYSQLEERYGKKAASIIDNCASLVFLGGKSTETNEMLSKMIGQQTVTTKNPSEQHSEHGSTSISTAQHARDLVQSAELSRLGIQECMVLLQGNQALKGHKVDPTQMAMWEYLDPGRPGARFARGFDFRAYRDNRRYYDHEASVVASAEVKVIERAPTRKNEATYEIAYAIKLKNTSDAPAYNVKMSAGLGCVCTTNEVAILAGKTIPYPGLERDYETGLAHANAGWEYATQCSTLGRWIQDIDNVDVWDDIISVQPTVKEYTLSGVQIPPHETVEVVLSMAISRDLTQLEIMAPACQKEPNIVEFAFTFEPFMYCANADVELAPRRDVVKIDSNYGFSVSQQSYIETGWSKLKKQSQQPIDDTRTAEEESAELDAQQARARKALQKEAEAEAKATERGEALDDDDELIDNTFCAA